MFKQFLLRMAGRVVARPVRRSIEAFHQATRDPVGVQSRLLQEILNKQKETQFGRDHRFSDIKNITQFRQHVPIAPYEYIAPYIERVKNGDIQALLADNSLKMFALTSGTTAARKLIPITQNYLEDYRRGWNIWGLTAFQIHRQAALKPVVQLVGDPEEFHSPGGIPCGNLSGFTAQIQKKIVRFLYCVPAISGRIKDSHARYYVALRFSITRSVGLLSSANPSTLVALARVLDQQKENLIRDIHNGTLNDKLDIPAAIRAELMTRKGVRPQPEKARLLETFVQKRNALLPMDIWPEDRLLIGCWTGGSVGPYLHQLKTYYGSTPVRDIGLLASEGRMTIPIEDWNPSGILDITSHYFEFVPEGEIDSPQPTVLAPHELQMGHHYYILPTTKSGLYRYHICDLVRVTGFSEKTPMIEFLGKGNRFANLTGEKISEYQVCRTFDQVITGSGLSISIYSLAPCWHEEQSYYTIYLEQKDVSSIEKLKLFLRGFDQQLQLENVEYAAKRESKRLGPLQAGIVADGFWQQWDRQRLANTGGSPEQYKHPCLLGDLKYQKEIPTLQIVLPE